MFLLYRFFCSLDSYFYKKLWEFQTFKDLLCEVNSIDEVFFYLHFRNLVFEGPQMAYKSATFEVTSFVSFEKIKHLMSVQFRHEDIVSNDLDSFIKDLESRTVLKGKIVCIDAYFALRMCLQYYIQEKKIYLTKLRVAFSRYSMVGDEDINTKLTFSEFREFCRGCLKNISEKDITRLYRLSWSFGNGETTFETFLSGADEMRILLKELQIENTYSLFYFTIGM